MVRVEVATCSKLVLVFACFYFRYPDHPLLLTTLVQHMHDRAPDLPGLNSLLRHWEMNLKGALHSVDIAVTTPAEFAGVRHALFSTTLQ